MILIAVPYQIELEMKKMNDFVQTTQARAQVDAYLSVFTFRVENALAAFPSHIVGHEDLVWCRFNEVIDSRINDIIAEFKVCEKIVFTLSNELFIDYFIS